MNTETAVTSSDLRSIIEDARDRSPLRSSGRSQSRVCLVTPDLIGPIRNGGIGTAFTALARVLAGAGVAVDILYVLGDVTETGSIESWIEHYAAEGITLVPLPDSQAETFHVSRERRISYRVMQWLLAADGAYDVIHFPDWRGYAYFSLLAKTQGFGLARPDIVIGAHSPDAWGREGARRLASDLTELETDFMERESVRLADVLISPTIHMLGWMRAAGWSLPARTFHLPNLPTLRPGRTAHASLRQPVREVVFFGRLEKRKGLDFFLDSLKRSNIVGDADLTITFLGKPVDLDGQRSETRIEDATRAWACQVKIIPDYDSKAATDYLAGPGRLAIIPSLADNAPYAVAECIAAHIPFLASDVGGIPELIHPDDRQDVLFAVWPQDFRARLANAIANGARLARGAYDASDVTRCWIEWHAYTRPHAKQPTPADAHPKVSVCLTHFNRPQLLSQALSSLRRQDYPNFEVVLADASDDAAAINAVHALVDEFSGRGWKIVMAEDRCVGALRNAAARQASGDYLIFMDDDNYAKPAMISIFMSVTWRTGADILTCMNSVFSGLGPPPSVEHEFWLPLGADTAFGLFQNGYGDANALVRRSVFQQMGGFTEVYNLGHEDYEFFSRAVLAGFQLQVVPFSLYWYRHVDNSMSRRLNIREAYYLSIRPLARTMTPDLFRGVQFAVGSWLDQREELDRLRVQNSQLWREKEWLGEEYRRVRDALESSRAGDSQLALAGVAPRTARGQAVKVSRPSFLARLLGRLGKAVKAPDPAIELVATSYLLDAGWYARHSELRHADPTIAARHYLAEGWRRGFDPGPAFSTADYLADNPDVAADGANPLVHYLMYGRHEFRRVRPSSRASPALPGETSEV